MGTDKYAYSKSGAKSSNSRGSDKGFQRDDEFVNVELNDEQADACRLFRRDLTEVNLVLTEMLEDGYKISARYDDRNECYAAFAFAAADSDNQGYILSGRGGSGLSALAELLFKHAHVVERNWPAFAARSRRRYSDDD